MREYIEASNSDMVLTNGIVFGKKILIEEGVDPNTYYEISEEEYNILLEQDNSIKQYIDEKFAELAKQII